ncbi:hypothetical protein GCM10027061_18460 [Nesterenkonia suensis]
MGARETGAGRPKVAAAGAVLAALLVLTGCGPTGGGGDDAAQEPEGGSTPTQDGDVGSVPETQATPVEDAEEENRQEDLDGAEAPAAEVPDPVTVEEVLWDFRADEEHRMTAEVGPIVREGDLAVLPILFDSDHPDEVRVHDLLDVGIALREGTSTRQGYDLRLIDAAARTVSHTAVLPADVSETGSFAISPRPDSVGQGRDPANFYAVFAAPESDSVHVLMRQLGAAEDVPVVDEPWAEDLPDVRDLMDETHVTLQRNHYPLDVLQARVEPLETYREGVEHQVGRLDGEEQSTVTIASDVLFDIDESELGPEADAVLEAAVAELDGAEGGALEIIGHTDDVLDEEHNQALSEARAESVHDRLEELTDLSAFDGVSTDGRAFHEPVASNGTEEGRAQNRRVELHFTPPAEPQVRDAAEAELPEALGAVAQHPETAEAEDFDITVDSVRQAGDVFIGRITVGATGESQHFQTALNHGWASGVGPRGLADGEVAESSQWSAYGPTMIVGDQRYYPMDYFLTPLEGGRLDDAESAETFFVPLADRYVDGSGADVGTYVRATVIWPAVDADEVTIDLTLPEEWEPDRWNVPRVDPWRVTEVPVEEG